MTLKKFPQRALNKPLSINSSVDPQDVLEVKLFLHNQGYYELPDYGITPYPDEAMFKSIKQYQKKKGLTVDGVMNINGETQETMKNSEIEREELPPPDMKEPKIPGTNIPDQGVEEWQWPLPGAPNYDVGMDPDIILKSPNAESRMPEWAQLPFPSSKYPRGGRY